jgi:hypothetical protein
MPAAAEVSAEVHNSFGREKKSSNDVGPTKALTRSLQENHSDLMATFSSLHIDSLELSVMLYLDICNPNCQIALLFQCHQP